MKIAIVTGSAGLIGSETARFFHEKEFNIVGIDNDMRKQFFGADASTLWNRHRLEEELPRYTHVDCDIRDGAAVEKVFSTHGKDIALVVHAAAQPSHDWAANDPVTDFTVNANGTLLLLEMTRRYCPDSVFIFMSTNKVYGDTPNTLPLVEREERWEVDRSHPFFEHGIDETMSLDHSKHSLFGVSKASADLLVQEYGRYFGMKTACFRGGCLTGPNHSGARLHGFLSYLVKCAVTGEPYTVFGYKGKQVRDNIHSFDLVNMFWHFYNQPRSGEVYNAGGGRFSNCSMIEAIRLIEEVSGKKMRWTYSDSNRSGDHIWYISDTRKFQQHYPGWTYRYDLKETVRQILESTAKRKLGVGS